MTAAFRNLAALAVAFALAGTARADAQLPHAPAIEAVTPPSLSEDCFRRQAVRFLRQIGAAGVRPPRTVAS